MKEAPSTAAALSVFLVLGAMLAPAAGAQPTRPIYPVYGGLRAERRRHRGPRLRLLQPQLGRGRDPAGDENGFDPGPADRGQPTVFEPGRQRNVCLIVLPADHEGNLSWSVTVAGNTGKTTERGGIDTLYLIENISMAYHLARRVDTATAEHGVCVEAKPATTGSER